MPGGTGDRFEWILKQLQHFFYTDKSEEEEREMRGWAKKLWSAHPWALTVLRQSKDLEIARRHFYEGIVERERAIRARRLRVHPLEWAIIRDSCKVLRNILSKRCEKLSGFSSFECLWNLAHRRWEELPKNLSAGFFEEVHRILLGVKGRSGIYNFDEEEPQYEKLEGREAALVRSEELDALAMYSESRINSYACGLDDEVIERRKENKKRVLKFFKGNASDWSDWRWHLKHVIRDEKILGELIELTDDQRRGIKLAKKHSIPFGITPYYCSLMDPDPNMDDDHAVRAQVIPSTYYVKHMIEHRRKGTFSADFMFEHETSPIDLVVRRYPGIAIFKPFNTCSQICVYCQRNWEIHDVLCKDALAPRNRIDDAIKWFAEHPMVREILITGGDAFVMKDDMIEYLLKRLSKLPHVERIRFGTRTPVVIPMRISAKLKSILARYHNPPKLDICIVTHFEHSYEVTPDAAEAVIGLRKLGISVYNQMVLTTENSRRFEAVATRLALKKIGVDPYYTFIMKGKEETNEMRVPIARALQEQKEEARLVPGVVRTDEVVYNVPRLGKNYVRAWQHHDVIMILPDGSRILEFHPWEKNISRARTYVDKDIPIYDYLIHLAQRGEDLKEYESIWYYY